VSLRNNPRRSYLSIEVRIPFAFDPGEDSAEQIQERILNALDAHYVGLETEAIFVEGIRDDE
jgi:hypothetical protein